MVFVQSLIFSDIHCRANHPDTIVYSQCSNKLLEHAIGLAQDSTLPPLRSLDPEVSECLPPLPQPGEVDFIYGGKPQPHVSLYSSANITSGPPCQSFSNMNHHKVSCLGMLIAYDNLLNGRIVRKQMISGMTHLLSVYCNINKLCRSTLVCNMISYVEYYRPMFFLLENVVGMLSYRLGGEQDHNRVVGGIEMGVVKFILGSLAILG